MGKQAGKPRQIAEYAGVRVLYALLTILPWSWASALGKGLALLWRRLDKCHRLLAEKQIQEHLAVSSEEAVVLAKKNFRHYGMVFAESCMLGRMSRNEYRERTNIGNLQNMASALLKQGKGLLYITAHLGNWEWGNALSKTYDLPGGTIARPLDNPYLNDFVKAVRERLGFAVLDKQGAMRRTLKTLRDNKAVAILVDQDAGPAGLMSLFLGKEASTIAIPVELAVKYGTPMIISAAIRDGEQVGRFSIVTHPTVFQANPDADRKEETRRLVDGINQALGELIKTHPEQWFWVHRRWKTRNGRSE